MKNNKKIKVAYLSEDYNLFISRVIDNICGEIKKLNINIKFNRNLLKEIADINKTLEDLISKYDSYNTIMVKFEEYWKTKKQLIFEVYLKNDFNGELDFNQNDENIKIIKTMFKSFSKEEILSKTNFNILENKIIDYILEGKNPYELVNNDLNVCAFFNYIDSIVNQLYDFYLKEELNNKIDKYDPKYIFYLDNISTVKKWAHYFPKNLRSLMYKKGMIILNNLTNLNDTSLTSQDILEKLNNMPVVTLKSNKKENLLISSNDINEYQPEDVFGQVIFEYYFKDINSKYNPENNKIYKCVYSDKNLEFEKKLMITKILDNIKGKH